MEDESGKDNGLTQEDLLLFLGDGLDDDNDMEVGSNASHDSDRMNLEPESGEGLPPNSSSSSSKSSPKSHYKSRSKQKESLLQQAFKSNRGLSRSPKSDVREGYSLRVVTAMNTVDFDAIFATISELCTASVVVHVNRESPHPHPDGNLFSTYIQGHVNVSKYLFGLMTLDPDSVIALKESKFHSKSSEGLVVFKTLYTATKMYNISTTMDVLSPAVSSEEIQAAVEPTAAPKAEDIVHEIDSIRNSLSIRHQPIPVRSVSEITLHTNKDKLIVKVVMNINLIENDLSIEEK